jgi:type VI secretion system protein VasI
MSRVTFATCFALFLALPAAAQGVWEVETKTSPMDDSVSVTLYNKATAIVDGTAQSAYLLLGCDDDTTNIAFIVDGEYFGALSDRMLTYRIDDASPEEVLATGHNTVVILRRGSIPIIKAMMDGSRALIEAVPINSHIIAEFDLTGLSEAIHPLRDACHW